MGNHKGIGICFVRDRVKAHGPDAVEQMAAGLTDEDAKVFKYTLATTWIDIEAATHILRHAALFLYPGENDGIRTIGYHMAQEHLTGVYRILLRVITVKFALSQTANYWDAYHRIGHAHIEPGDTENSASLVIADYPGLPDAFREMLIGYIHGIMDLAGASNGTVVRRSLPGGRWAWDMTWT